MQCHLTPYFLQLTCLSYVQVTSSTLSLPLSTGTTVLTILLPFLAAVNTFGRLHQTLPRTLSAFPALQQFLPLVPLLLQILQGVLAAVLATLTAEGFAPGQVLDCGLEINWQSLWHTHDGRAIQRIQDSFNCCGLRSLVDRDWPRHQCQELYKNRHVSCLAPWRSSMQRSAGLGFTVAVAVGILQVSCVGYLGGYYLAPLQSCNFLIATPAHSTCAFHTTHLRRRLC